MNDLDTRIAGVERRVGTLESMVRDNTGVIGSIKGDTEELLAILHASRFGASLVKWVATVGAAIVAAWTAVRHWPR